MTTEIHSTHNRITLAIDTSQPALGLALARGPELLFSLVDNSGLPHSQQLFPLLAATLQRLNLAITEIDCFVVNTGPGSFTGLRVGLAAVNGLADTLGKPLLGITAIDATALTLEAETAPLVVLLKAARGELFCGVRQRQADFTWQQTGTDRALPWAQVERDVEAQFGAAEVVFIGNGAEAHASSLMAHGNWRRAETPTSLAPVMASWASRQLPTQTKAKIAAYYLRPAEAEIKLAQ